MIRVRPVKIAPLATASDVNETCTWVTLSTTNYNTVSNNTKHNITAPTISYKAKAI